MSSAHYEAMSRSIDNMVDWKAAAICAVCASKVVPIVARLALPDTWRLVEECIQFVWGNLGQSSNNENGEMLAKALESTPEWQCEDNSFLPFAVTEALDFVKLAVLAVAVPSSAKENAKGAIDLLVGLASSYDFSAKKFLAKEPAKASNVRLQTSEEASQERLVKMLEKLSAPSSQTVDALRREATDIAELIKALLPMVCYEHTSS
jgi:hypothetical protein